MSTLYCLVKKDSQHTMIHLLDSPRPDAQPVDSLEDLRRIIAESGAQYVYFYGAWLPRRAVAVDHAKLDSYTRDALGLVKHRPAKPYVPVVDPDFDPAEYIDGYGG